MATLAPDIKALQARATQQAKTAKTEQDALLQATKSSDVSGQQAAGSALAKSGNALVSGFGQGLAAVSAIKEGSSRKKALEQLKTQVETQAAKQQELLTLAEEAKVTQQNTANAAPTMIDIISAVNNGTITPEEGDSRLTQAIIGTNPNRLEGTQASWNSEAQRIDLVKDGVVDSEGINNIINLLPTEELKFAANESLYGAATKQAQAEAQADIATAEAKAEAGRGATRDERIGLGLESTTQRTQEVATPVSESVLIKSGGAFQSPEALSAANNANQKIWQNRVGAILENAPVVTETLNSYRQAADILKNADKDLTGFGAEQVQILSRVGQALDLNVNEEDIANRGKLQSLFKDAAIKKLQTFKGATTDFEFKQSELAGANPDRTPKENLLILETVAGAAEKESLRAPFLQQYTEGQPALLIQAENRFNQFLKQVPSSTNNKEEILQQYMNPSFKPVLDDNGLYTGSVIQEVDTPSTIGTASGVNQFVDQNSIQAELQRRGLR